MEFVDWVNFWESLKYDSESVGYEMEDKVFGFKGFRDFDKNLSSSVDY